MAQINLLNWREERRRQQTRDFGRQAVLAVVLALAVGGYAWYHVNGLIDHQHKRNDFLQDQIHELDKKIAAIDELQTKRNQLVARMKVIEQLQQRRPQIVHLFFELADTLPNGVYLDKIIQEGDKLEIKGRAESKTRVSSYMRKLQASAWMKAPKLQVIKSDKNPSINNFTLKLSQTTPNKDSDGGDKSNGDHS